MNMEINAIRALVTVVSFVTFLLIVAWAMRAANAKRFDEAARLPLEEDQ